MNWKDYVLEQAKDEKANISVLMADAKTGQELFAYDKDRKVVSASTIKVAIMLCALDEVMLGTTALDEELLVKDSVILDDSQVFEYGAEHMTLDGLIKWMIITSDNTATNTLINYLTMEKINTYCKWLGLTSTRVERIMLDFDAIEQGRNNFTSAADQCIMFRALYKRSIITPELCDYAMDVLLGQRCKDDFTRYIPENLKLAHKTGGLDCLNHDSGIFFLDNIDYYLGVFVTDAPDDIYAKRVIGRISKRIYDEFK